MELIQLRQRNWNFGFPNVVILEETCVKQTNYMRFLREYTVRVFHLYFLTERFEYLQ